MFKIFAITSVICEIYSMCTVRKRDVRWFNNEFDWIYSGGGGLVYWFFSLLELVMAVFILLGRFWYIGVGLGILAGLSFKFPKSIFFYYVSSLLSVLLFTAYIILA